MADVSIDSWRRTAASFLSHARDSADEPAFAEKSTRVDARYAHRRKSGTVSCRYTTHATCSFFPLKEATLAAAFTEYRPIRGRRARIELSMLEGPHVNIKSLVLFARPFYRFILEKDPRARERRRERKLRQREREREREREKEGEETVRFDTLAAPSAHEIRSTSRISQCSNG